MSKEVTMVSLATLQKEFGMSDTKSLLATAKRLKMDVSKAWNPDHKLVWAVSEADATKLREVYASRTTIRCS